MRRNSLIITAVLTALLTMSFAAYGQEMMTNDEVISLTKAGLASSVIIGKIHTSKSNFDMSTDALIKLKQSGVGDDVVTAMLEAKSGVSTSKPASGPTSTTTGAAPVGMTGDPNDPMAKHNYGIYLYEEKDGVRRMTLVKPTVSAQNRTGGLFTSSLTYGITKVKTKANLPGRTSALQIPNTAPVFYFYLDVTSGGLNTSSGIPSDPNEFTLVRFNIRDDNREVTIGKANAFGGKGGRQHSTLDELAAPLEEVGGIIDQFAPAFEHVLARVGDILAGRFDGFPALLGFIGNQLARILAALRGVKDRCRGANEGARQEPCDIAGGLALRLVCFRAFVRHVKRAPQ